MTHRLERLDVIDAAYYVAKQYPGNVEALSLRLGLGAGTLRKKLGRHVETHVLTTEELSEVVDLCGQARVSDAKLPIRALCWRHGGVFIELPHIDGLADDAFLMQVIATAKEQGDVISKIEEALVSDRQIDARELRAIEKEFEEAMAAQAELLEMVRALAGK